MSFLPSVASSSCLLSMTRSAMNATSSSCSRMFAAWSAKARSASIIQNSVRCLAVLDFSALKAGWQIQTFSRPARAASS